MSALRRRLGARTHGPRPACRRRLGSRPGGPSLEQPHPPQGLPRSAELSYPQAGAAGPLLLGVGSQPVPLAELVVFMGRGGGRGTSPMLSPQPAGHLAGGAGAYGSDRDSLPPPPAALGKRCNNAFLRSFGYLLLRLIYSEGFRDFDGKQAG